MNAPMRYYDFAYIAKTLLAQDWIFAKTMPQNPHHYALRKNFKPDGQFSGDSLFEHTVTTMREYSYDGTFGGRKYKYFNVNGHYYWTMGALVKDTILINRKQRGPTAYDGIAAEYKGLFDDAESLKENEYVLDMINYKSGSMLEIGCASCPLVEKLPILDYTGIDPSEKMIEICRQNNTIGSFIRSDFEAFYPGERRFDYIVATFGAASYIETSHLQRVNELLNPGGRVFLMFYKDEYTPKTYRKTGICLEWNKGGYKVLPGKTREYRDYVILSN
jgi:hypothetical protein